MRKIGRLLKKTVLWILGILLMLVLIVSALVYAAFKHPQDTWQLVQKHVLPKDLIITWDTIDFSSNYVSRLGFHFDLGFKNLRIQKQKPFMDIPVDAVRITATVFPLAPETRLYLNDLELVARQTLRFSPNPSKKPHEEIDPFQQTRTIVDLIRKVDRWCQFEFMHLQVDRFQLEKNELPTFALSLKIDQPTKRAPIHVEAALVLPQQKELSVQANADLAFDNFETENPFLTANVFFQGFGVEARQNLNFAWQNEVLNFRGQGPVRYSKNKMHFRVDPFLRLRMNDSEARLNLNASVSGLPGPVGRIDRLTASARVPLQKNRMWSDQASTFRVSAPVPLFFIDKNMRPPMEKSCECKIPEYLSVDLKGEAWLPVLFSEPKNEEKLANADLSIESIANKLVSTDLKAQVTILKKEKEFQYEPRLNSTIIVHSYQGVRHFLDAKGIMIPSPFDILEGTLVFKASGAISPSKENYDFPMELDVALASKKQKVNLRSEAKASLARNFKKLFVDVMAKIQDLQLELPPLDPIAGIPRVLPDRRILKTPKELKTSEGKKIELAVAMQVETTRPGAIRLLTQFADPLVPITVKIQKPTLRKTQGFMQTEPFDLVYMRRRVRVEKMRLDFNTIELGVIPVDGRLVVQQTEYKIFIDILGPIQRPVVRLSSEPYLPRSEIISVLLYDRTSDQLIGADNETVGSFDAAIADRAIGLFGLWAFASTPIRSFSYNPVTKVYAATVTLSDDLSAGVGTNWEEATQFELRKRVSRQWVLTATWMPATREEREQERLVLQWEKRF